MVAEVDCRLLYMRCLDGTSLRREPVPEDPVDAPWTGEPPARIATRSPAEVLDAVGLAIAGKDRLRVLDTHWLDQSPFRDQFEQMLTRFRAGGGEVEFATRAVERR
jgi:hypothetical protein